VALTQAVTETDEWSLSALADQAAVALENARIGGEVRLDLESRLRASEGATSNNERALSTLAHDIRSPLGAIEGYCTILEDGLLGPTTNKQRDALARIRMSGRHLLSLLDNVMDMARLTAGPGVVHAEPTPLRRVAGEGVDMLLPASYGRHQQLRLLDGEDVLVMGDGARVRQVIVNLIGNALKFTPIEGIITVAVSRLSSGGVEWGEVRVTDTGPGIALSDQAAIFEPYFRSKGTAAIAGVGLGLAISHALVRQMGGTLDVASTPGEGASFMVRLHLAPGHVDNRL
jgi:signal transduction histidine kinase